MSIYRPLHVFFAEKAKIRRIDRAKQKRNVDKAMEKKRKKGGRRVKYIF